MSKDKGTNVPKQPTVPPMPKIAVNMEDERRNMSDNTMSLFVDSLSYMATRGQMRKSMENGSDIHLCLYAEDEDEEMLLDLGKAPQEIINEVFYYDD